MKTFSRLLLLSLFVFNASSFAEPYTGQCRILFNETCSFPLNNSESWTIHLTSQPVSANEIKLTGIKLIAADNNSASSFSLSPIEPFFTDEPVEIYFGDINFDAATDFWLVTAKGVANSYADYWIYSQPHGQFIYLGNYPWLTTHPDSKTLTSYERGGYAGLNYTKKEYQFLSNTLQVTREEIQLHDPASNKTTQQVRTLIEGELKEINQ